MVDYINGLREGILEAYVGIIGGLKTGAKVDILLPHVNSILTFLHLTLTDQDRTEAILRSSIGLLGDLAEAFPGGELKEALSGPWVGELLKVGRTKIGGPETKKVAKWAREVSSTIYCLVVSADLRVLDGPTCDAIISPFFRLSIRLFSLRFCFRSISHSTRHFTQHIHGPSSGLSLLFSGIQRISSFPIVIIKRRT